VIQRDAGSALTA